MSDYRSIAVVTAVFRQRLQEIANEAVGGATVTVSRPDARDEAVKDAPGINLFLYRVAESGTFRNQDVPTRDAGGNLTTRPVIGLELEFLMTFYGGGLTPHLLLGRTVADLRAEPFVSSSRIEEALAHLGSVQGGASVAKADLAQQVERIGVSPVPMTLEELSKLWSVFLQVPYDLSIAYRASVVMIEAEVAVRDPAPPPKFAHISVQALRDDENPAHQGEVSRPVPDDVLRPLGGDDE